MEVHVLTAQGLNGSTKSLPWLFLLGGFITFISADLPFEWLRHGDSYSLSSPFHLDPLVPFLLTSAWLPARVRAHTGGLEGRATHLIGVIDGDLEASQNLPLWWVLIHGQLKPVLGPALSIERRGMVVQVHDPDGDGGHGLVPCAPFRTDLSHLGRRQGVWLHGRWTLISPSVPSS